MLAVISIEAIFVTPGFEIQLERLIHISAHEVIRREPRQDLRVSRKGGVMHLEKRQLILPLRVSARCFHTQGDNKNGRENGHRQ